MKIAVIVLLCFGAALARIEEWNALDSFSQNRRIEDSAFRPGREYHFFYNGQLTTGIAGSSKQHSANRIQTMVTVAMKSQNQVILRLQNVRLGKMNRQIPNPRKMMPFEAFEDEPIEQHLKQKLEAPVKFSYTNGMIRDVEFDTKEEPWSANIKRGVLNLLQVNLQQHRRIESPEEAMMKNQARARPEDVDERQPIFYRVMEETLEGECETLYTIQRQPERRSSNNPVLNVTKSINFEKCNKRPQIKYNFRFAGKCPSCDPKYDEDEKFLKSSTVVQYNITGDKDSFLIESARVESQYVLAPFDEEANVIVTYVNQTLVLVKTGPIQQHQEPQNPIKSDSNMIFTLDWNIAHEKFMMHGQSESTRRILQNGQTLNKVEMVKKILQKMTQQIKETVDEEVPRKFSRLIQWLRQCDQQELEQIVRMQEPGHLSPEEEKKVKNIIPQALGACGTKECVKQLTQKIRQGHIAPLRAVFALKGLLHTHVVSKDIITELIQLAESDKARESEPLKRACWLTIGSLINALCAENEDQLALEFKEDAKKLCGREQKETYVKLLFDKLRQSNKWQDKLLMLKAVGNAGLDLSIFELEKIILQKESQHPIFVRLESILALRELKEDMPKKIQRILMPIAMNRREYPTVRSFASLMLLQTQPERAVLDQLARSLINEPSHQYASFLYTQLENYANSTNPCEQKLATDCKLALRQAKKVNTGIFGYSRMSHSTFHNEKQKIGIDLDWGAIYSNISAIPRHIGAAIHTTRFGYWQKHLTTITLFNEGLESLYRDYFTERNFFSRGGSSSSNSLFDALSRHPRNVRNGENGENGNEYERELDEISSKHLKIKNRHNADEYENEPKAYFTAIYKSQTVAVLPIGKEILQQWMQDGQSSGLDLLQKLQRGLPIDYVSVAQMHDVHLKIPTTLGLPLSITLEAPMAVSVKGKIQANLESLRSKTVKVVADLKPSLVSTFSCRVEAWSPITVSGVKVQAKAKVFTPIDAKLEIEWGQNPQVKAMIKPPTSKRDLVVFESRPITYTRSWQKYLLNPDEESSVDEQTIVGEEVNRAKTFTHCAGRQTWGVEVCARGQVQCLPDQKPTGTPIGLLSGQNKVVIYSQPSESPQDIEIRLSSKVQKINGAEVHKPSFSILGRQQPFQDDDTDSDSESDETSQQQQPDDRQSRERRQQHQHQRSQPRQRQSNRDVFQQYRDYQVKNGYKTQLDVEVKAAHNGRSTLELAHWYDARNRYGKVNMKMQQHHSGQQWQACLDAEMMFPENPQFVQDVKDKKVVGHANLRWGQSCNEQNYVQITTQAERSRQQVQWERDQSDYKQYRSQECRNNKQWCSSLTQEDFVEKIGHMLKYRVDIDYQNVPPHVQNMTNKLYRALKYQYFWQTDVDQVSVRNSEGKIRAELVLDAQTKQRLNVTIKTPKENIMIQDLPLSRPVMPLNQKQSFGDQLRNYMNRDEENDDQTECAVTGRSGWRGRSQVETFDGTKFSAPFTNCWVVLAKDCGSQKPEFVVMARKSEQNGDLKDVKIITRQHRIELKPESADLVKVTVNGRPYDPENEEDLVDHGHVVAKIDKEGESISVELPETGVEVEFDGYAINVKLSSWYHGQQCGLCGHNDQEEADEFRNPDFTEEDDVRQFYMNYLIKDGRCQAPKQLNEVCQNEDCDLDRSSSSSSSSSSDEDDNDNDDTTEKPDHKTKVIEIDDKICFSTIPVPQCDDNSYAVEIKQQKPVPYTCVDQDSEEAEEYERKARYGKKAIPNLTSRTPNFTRTESIPEKCKKYKS